jgi:hypothetical protein
LQHLLTYVPNVGEHGRGTEYMSAVPKLKPDFWMTSRAAEITVPEFTEIPNSPSGTAIHTPRSAREIKAPRLSILPPLAMVLRFERAITFAIIVLGLMTLAALSHQALTAKIDARDYRMEIQQLNEEVGLLRTELQQSRASLERSDAPEGLSTMPIEP